MTRIFYELVRGLRRRRRCRQQTSRPRALAEHPYAAEIAACRGWVFINCSSFNDPRIPDGEIGPQCDAIRDSGLQVLAMDDRYVYCDDGERYPVRVPRRATSACPDLTA